MTVAELEVIIDARIDKFRAKLQQAERETKSFAARAGDSILQGIGLAIGQFSAQSLVQGIVGVTRSMISGNAEMERYETQFGVLLGTIDEAKARMAELATFAERTPFELPEIVAASRQLQVMGGTALATGETLTMVGDMASASGAGYQEVATWVGRLYSALKGGRPFGESAQRLQELGLLSGETRNRMEALAKEGAKATEVWDTFTTSAGQFGGMMDKQARDFWGMVSTLRDEVAAILRELGGPIFDKLKVSLKSFLELLQSDQGKVLVGTLASIVAGIVAAGTALASFAAYLKIAPVVQQFGAMITKAGGAMKVLRTAIAALTGPVGWVIAAASLIATAWIKNWGDIRGFVTRMVDQIVGWWQENLPLIQETAQRVLGLLKAAWETIAPVVMAEWGRIVNVLKAAWATIKGIIEIAWAGVSGFLKTAMQVINGDWSGAWQTMLQTSSNVGRAIVRTVASVMASLLRSIDSALGPIMKAWHEFKKSMGLASGDAPGKTFLGGWADSLDLVAKQFQAVTASAKTTSSETVKAASAISKAANASARDGLSGVVMGGGSKDRKGGKPKVSDAQRQIEQQAEALRGRIDELTKAIGLNGNELESASLKYDIAKGRIAAVNVPIAKTLVGLLEQTEALAKQSEAQRDAEERARSFAGMMSGLRAQLLSVSAATETDRVAIDMKVGSLKELTWWERMQVLALTGRIDKSKQAKDATEAEKSRIDGQVRSVKDLVASLNEEIRLRAANTRLKRLEIELEKSPGADPNDKDAARKAASTLDALESADRYRARWKEFWDDVRQTMRRAQEEATRRYGDAMKELSDRVGMAGNSAEVSAFKFQKLTEAFGGGEVGAQRARQYLDELTRVDRVEQFRETLTVMARTTEESFMRMFDHLFEQGFGGFFSNVAIGFRKLLADLAREYLASQLRGLLARVIGLTIDSAFGGSGAGQQTQTVGTSGTAAPIDVPGRAFGGPVSAGQIYEWQENGREYFVPSTNGRVLSPSESKAATSGRPIVVNIHAKDADTFDRNRTRMLKDFAAQLRLVTQNAT